jgi:protein gp37
MVARRYAGLTANGEWTGEARLHEDMLPKPMRMVGGRVFAIWNDLFWDAVPDGYIALTFAVMRACPQHRFLILTKRPARAASWVAGNDAYVGMARLLERFDRDPEYSGLHPRVRRQLEKATGNVWPLHNVAIGTTVGCRSSVGRLAELAAVPASMRFVSCAPLLEDLAGIVEGHRWVDWWIAECESAVGCAYGRPMELAWARQMLRECREGQKPFFLKQAVIRGGLWAAPGLDGEACLDVPTWW